MRANSLGFADSLQETLFYWSRTYCSFRSLEDGHENKIKPKILSPLNIVESRDVIHSNFKRFQVRFLSSSTYFAFIHQILEGNHPVILVKRSSVCEKLLPPQHKMFCEVYTFNSFRNTDITAVDSFEVRNLKKTGIIGTALKFADP